MLRRISLLLVLATLPLLPGRADGGWPAVDVPPGGRELLPAGFVLRAALPAAPGKATARVIEDPSAPAARFLRIDVTARPASSWNVQAMAKLTESIKKDDRCFLLFYARAVKSTLENGQAVGAANVELQQPPDYTKLGHSEFHVGAQWEPVIVPFTASIDLPAGSGAVAIHLGGEIQSVDLAGARLVDYGPDFPAAKLPRPRVTYPGREAGAPWRQAALYRIEKLRKSDFTLQVVDSAGLAVQNATVQVTQTRSAFGFGSAVTARLLVDPGPDGEKYRAIVDSLFSKVVFENDLKPFAWEEGASNTGTKFRRAWTDQAFTWLAERHLAIRGHYLMWGPFESWSEKLKSDPAKIRETIFTSLRERLAAFDSRVTEWDCLNHPAGWEAKNNVDTVCGDTIYADVLRECRQLTKKPLWVNEDQLFRPGRQGEDYTRVIQSLIAAGLKPDGIANMAHIHSSFLPSPDVIQKVSDRYAALVPNLQISEYDLVSSGDEVLEADYLRDFLISCYSHPAYSGFIMWGFWEGTHWKPEAALWRQDWSEKPAAAAWREWVAQKWRTTATLTLLPSTPASGLAFRGFHGHYRIQATSPAGSATVETDLLPASGPVRIVIR